MVLVPFWFIIKIQRARSFFEINLGKLDVKNNDYLTRVGRIMAKKKEVVQIKNPKSGHYVKIDRSAGKIISHKKTSGPYKGVPVARKRSK